MLPFSPENMLKKKRLAGLEIEYPRRKKSSTSRSRPVRFRLQLKNFEEILRLLNDMCKEWPLSKTDSGRPIFGLHHQMLAVFKVNQRIENYFIYMKYMN